MALEYWREEGAEEEVVCAFPAEASFLRESSRRRLHKDTSPAEVPCRAAVEAFREEAAAAGCWDSYREEAPFPAAAPFPVEDC